MPPDNGERLRQVSLLEVAEDVMHGQGIQKHRDYVDSHIDQEQSWHFCVNVPCIPLNLEVPLPTLYAFTLFCFRLSHFLFRDFDDFRCVLNRVCVGVASDLGSSWLHASQQSSMSPWQISAAGLATFIHVCVGSMICFLSHDEINPISHHELNFDKKGCDAVYLQPGDAL